MSQSDPSDDTQNRAVGYGRPPVNRQFKPGQSGNPRGRPKGRKNFARMLAEALDEKVRVRDSGGRIHTLSKQEAMIKAVVNKGLGGDPKVVEKVFQLADKYGAFKEQLQSVAEEVDRKLRELCEGLGRLAPAEPANQARLQNESQSD